MSIEYSNLLKSSAAATQLRRKLERQLLECEPGSERGNRIYRLLKRTELTESKLRNAVRNHPEHTYDGL